MRSVTPIVLGLVLVCLGRTALAAPDRLPFSSGLKGVKQRLLGKVVREGNTVHRYAASGDHLQLETTETTEKLAKRDRVTRIRFRALDDRMSVAEATELLGGVKRRGYLYDVSKPGLAKLELKSQLLEKHTVGGMNGFYLEREYQLKDGVIKQWSNSNGTTFQLP